MKQPIRISIDIPDKIYWELKQKALDKKTTIKKLVEEIIKK